MCVFSSVYHLQGGLHITDITNASRTMMMNIQTHDWDDDLLAIVGISRSALPTIRSCSEIYGLGKGVLEGVSISGRFFTHCFALFMKQDHWVTNKLLYSVKPVLMQEK